MIPVGTLCYIVSASRPETQIYRGHICEVLAHKLPPDGDAPFNHQVLLHDGHIGYARQEALRPITPPPNDAQTKRDRELEAA